VTVLKTAVMILKIQLCPHRNTFNFTINTEIENNLILSVLFVIIFHKIIIFFVFSCLSFTDIWYLASVNLRTSTQNISLSISDVAWMIMSVSCPVLSLLTRRCCGLLKHRPEPTNFLIKCNASVNAVDKVNRNSPLHCAVLAGNVDAAHILLEAGASVDLENSNVSIHRHPSARVHFMEGECYYIFRLIYYLIRN